MFNNVQKALDAVKKQVDAEKKQAQALIDQLQIEIKRLESERDEWKEKCEKADAELADASENVALRLFKRAEEVKKDLEKDHKREIEKLQGRIAQLEEHQELKKEIEALKAESEANLAAERAAFQKEHKGELENLKKIHEEALKKATEDLKKMVEQLREDAEYNGEALLVAITARDIEARKAFDFEKEKARSEGLDAESTNEREVARRLAKREDELKKEFDREMQDQKAREKAIAGERVKAMEFKNNEMRQMDQENRVLKASNSKLQSKIQQLQTQLASRPPISGVSQTDTASQTVSPLPEDFKSSMDHPTHTPTLSEDSNASNPCSTNSLASRLVSAVDPNLEDSDSEEPPAPARLVNPFGFQVKTDEDRRAEAEKNFEDKTEAYGWLHGRHGTYLFNPDTPGIRQMVLPPLKWRELQKLTHQATGSLLNKHEARTRRQALSKEQLMQLNRKWVEIDKKAWNEIKTARKEAEEAKKAAKKSNPKKRKVVEIESDEEDDDKVPVKHGRFDGDDGSDSGVSSGDL